MVPAIAGEDVGYAFTHTRVSAAGLDPWEPAELRFFSELACASVARLYNLIESGAPLPRSAAVAEAAFLPKDEAEDGEVMSYRLHLTIAAPYCSCAAI